MKSSLKELSGSGNERVSEDLEKEKSCYGELSCHGRYTVFSFNGINITFLHGKDLKKYLAVKEWDNGYMVVDCLGKIKGHYEDYIDLSYILENLYMNPDDYLKNIKEVRISNA